MDNKGVPPPACELEVQAISEERPSVKELITDYNGTVQGVAQIVQMVIVYTSTTTTTTICFLFSVKFHKRFQFRSTKVITMYVKEYIT